MSYKIKLQLIEAGVEINEALSRFMESDELYFKFLKMFINDNSFDNMKEALSSGDIKKAYSHAHTLKGVASNLSFNRFIDCLLPIHNSLKDGVNKDYTEEINSLNKEYAELVTIIKEIK